MNARTSPDAVLAMPVIAEIVDSDRVAVGASESAEVLHLSVAEYESASAMRRLARCANPDASNADLVQVVSFCRASAQTAARRAVWRSVLSNIPPMIPGELTSDYRVRLALEQAHSDERRRNELLELSATANAPHARIRAWERTHGLTLPRNEAHPVLSSIAAATRLTLDQVRDEQRRRLLPVSSSLQTV